MFFRQIKDPVLAQYSYLIGCQKTGEAIIFDPLRDVDQYLEATRKESLRLVAAAETHIHADFLAGTRELAETHGIKPIVSDCGPDDWKSEWAKNASYDCLFLEDGTRFAIGGIEFQAIHTPGHTPEHVIYLVFDKGGGADLPMGIISGDFVFVGDVGRPDLLESAAGVSGAMEPSAKDMYASLMKFMDFPNHLQVWPGHGSGSACGKALGAVPMSTVGYEKTQNKSIAAAIQGEQPFIDFILDAQPEPPFYFANMKKLNKEGAPVLGSLPQPNKLSIEELITASSEGSILLDTRSNRVEFMQGHLPGSLYAPLGQGLAAAAGSYASPGEKVFLIAEECSVEDAVRTLIRIGFDQVVGYCTPSELTASGKATATTRRVSFAAISQELGQEGSLALDVRSATEFAEGHVPNAINIAHTRLVPRLAEVPEADPIYVYCRTGQRASYAVSMLERLGKPAVYVDDLFTNHQRTTCSTDPNCS